MPDISKLRSSVIISRSFDVWVQIVVPIEMVFDALTTAAGLRSWWCSDAESDPRPGGAVKYVWQTGDEVIVGEGVYRKFVRPKEFEVQWLGLMGQPLKSDGNNIRGARWPTIERFELTANSPSNTRLHVHDPGINSDAKYDELHRNTMRGWVNSLANLKSVCETGRDVRMELDKQ